MIDVRHAYALAREIDGKWYVLSHSRDDSVIVCLHAEIEPIISIKKEIEEQAGSDIEVQVVRIVDDAIYVIKDPKPLKIGSKARAFRLDNPS